MKPLWTLSLAASLIKITMSTRMFLPLIVLVCFSSAVNSIEFQVGDDKGWTIPNVRQEDRDFYNDWASKHRFKINDTIRFKYEKDSVLVVTEEEYHKCKASHPIFFSNNDDTVFTLDRSGLFYFISGVAGHCERGQKMIIKVLEEQQQQAAGRAAASPSSSVVPGANQTSGGGSSSSTAPSSAAVSASSSLSGSVMLVMAMVVIPCLG